MDPKIESLTLNSKKNFENVIVQQIGAPRKIPILPKPPLLDEPKILSTSSTILNTNDNLSGAGINHNLSSELHSQSRSIPLEKINTLGISNDLTKIQTIGTQGLISKTSPLVINSSGASSHQNLIKILPKLPVKSIQRSSTGNLLVQGPNNKILSLQIKSPNLVPTVGSNSNSTVIPVLPNNTSTIHLNKNMQLLQNKITTSASLVVKSTPPILSTSSITLAKPVQLSPVQATGNQISATSIRGSQPHVLNNAITSQIRISENVIVTSSSNQSKQINNFSQNRNITPSLTSKVQSYSNIISGNLLQSTTSSICSVSSSPSVAQTFSCGETALAVSSGPAGISAKKIVLPMGKISSNITISKTSFNSRHGPKEEPSPSISLIEKRNISLNSTPISSNAQVIVSSPNSFANFKNITSPRLHNVGTGINTSEVVSIINKDTNLHTAPTITKTNENMPFSNLESAFNNNEENITIITQFIPEQKMSVAPVERINLDSTSTIPTIVFTQTTSAACSKSNLINTTTSSATSALPHGDSSNQIVFGQGLISSENTLTSNSQKIETNKMNNFTNCNKILTLTDDTNSDNIEKIIPEQKMSVTPVDRINLDSTSTIPTIVFNQTSSAACSKSNLINSTTSSATAALPHGDSSNQIVFGQGLIGSENTLTINSQKIETNKMNNFTNCNQILTLTDDTNSDNIENNCKTNESFSSRTEMEEESKIQKDNEKLKKGTDISVNNEDIGIQNQKTPQKLIKVFGISGKLKAIKQQSLLKNKNLENLKRSPRTLGRSKSLSHRETHKKRAERRLSATSDNKQKNQEKEITKENQSCELIQNLQNLLIEQINKTPTPAEKLNQTLLCEEKIETSPNVSSESNSSANNTLSEVHKRNVSKDKISVNLEKNMAMEQVSILHNPVPVIEDQKQQKSLPVNHNNESDSNRTISNRSSPVLIEQIISTIKPTNVPKNTTHISELSNILKWRIGIGLTKDASIAFRINELGLLEIFEKNVNRSRLDIAYEKPIYQRDKQSHKPEEYSEPIYFCKGCNCHGAAIDFLAPEYCSHECINRYEKKKVSKSNLQQIYIGQQRHKKLRKQKMSALLNDSMSLLNNNVNPKRVFSWSSYLSASNAQPAPIDLFLNPFPCGPNLFQVGMKLEAIDPEYSSLFCVCSVVEIKGYRLKIHFDGYSSTYDFWINADSMDIFPPGWCAKTNRVLQPPKHMNPSTFNWSTYLMKTKTIPAPRNLFTHLNSSSNTNPFKVGVRFEADDLRNTRKVCAASVADVLDNRILVHFDGWDDRYDYWVDCNSPYIHPVNWHLQNNFEIVPPPDWKDIFDWRTYLNSINGIPATEDYFQTREPISFKIGMKLEIVDKKNLSLIRPGTVIMTDGYEIKVLFDGWPLDYSFWVVDDSPDIHPIGWCDATLHELESPPGFESLPSIMPCPVIGCRGIGNAKRFDIDFHATEDSCPYLLTNWKKELEKPERVNYAAINVKEYACNIKRKHNDLYNWEIPSKYKKTDDNPNILTTQSALSISSTDNTEHKTQQQNLINLIENLPHMKTEEKQNENNINNQIVDPKIQLTKHLLCDYGPRLEQSYKLWLKYAQEITEKLEKIHKNPLHWKVDEVVQFLNRIPQCKDISELFYKEDIDGEAFLSLRQNDLTDILKIKLGTAIKIYNLIILLRAEVISQFS